MLPALTCFTPVLMPARSSADPRVRARAAVPRLEGYFTGGLGSLRGTGHCQACLRPEVRDWGGHCYGEAEGMVTPSSSDPDVYALMCTLGYDETAHAWGMHASHHPRI